MIVVSAAVAALALGGCGATESTENSAAETGEVFLTNATAEEVAKQAAAANRHARMQPGQWEQKIEIVSVDLSAMPEGPQKSAAETALRPSARENNRCITEEQAERANMQAMASGAQNCFYHRLQIADGRIDANFTCTTPQSDKVVSTMRGVYEPTKIDLTIDSTTEFASHSGKIGTQMRISGNRTGACTG